MRLVGMPTALLAPHSKMAHWPRSFLQSSLAKQFVLLADFGLKSNVCTMGCNDRGMRRTPLVLPFPDSVARGTSCLMILHLWPPLGSDWKGIHLCHGRSCVKVEAFGGKLRISG